MQQLQLLGMPDGQFSVLLQPLDTTSLAPHGLENIEFLVSANPGQPLRGLAKVASGGELSRISLAIQVITAQTSRVPTLVFDEVDVGIGGPTAEIVGQLLRQLGANRSSSDRDATCHKWPRKVTNTYLYIKSVDTRVRILRLNYSLTNSVLKRWRVCSAVLI